MQNLLTIQKTFYKVADFISWKKGEILDLSPYFQRRSVWNKGAKSFLIDSIYRGLPIPIIFLRDRGVNMKTFQAEREVIDGQQRLRTLISFIAPDLLNDFDPNRDDFTVKKTHNKELSGKKFIELSTDEQEKILNYEFNVHIIPSNIDDKTVIQIFRRMNSTNFTLNKQELLNAEYFGEFKTSQYELAAEYLDKWRKWKVFKEEHIAKMDEVRLTSEICISILESKILRGTDANIKKVYGDFDETYPLRDIIEDRFRNTMSFIERNFENSRTDTVLFTKAIFYSFFVSIYHLLYGGIDETHIISKSVAKKISNEVIENIITKGERLKRKDVSQSLIDAITKRTNDAKERKKLFDYLTS